MIKIKIAKDIDITAIHMEYELLNGVSAVITINEDEVSPCEYYTVKNVTIKKSGAEDIILDDVTSRVFLYLTYGNGNLIFYKSDILKVMGVKDAQQNCAYTDKDIHDVIKTINNTLSGITRHEKQYFVEIGILVIRAFTDVNTELYLGHGVTAHVEGENEKDSIVVTFKDTNGKSCVFNDKEARMLYLGIIIFQLRPNNSFVSYNEINASYSMSTGSVDNDTQMARLISDINSKYCGLSDAQNINLWENINRKGYRLSAPRSDKQTEPVMKFTASSMELEPKFLSYILNNFPVSIQSINVAVNIGRAWVTQDDWMRQLSRIIENKIPINFLLNDYSIVKMVVENKYGLLGYSIPGLDASSELINVRETYKAFGRIADETQNVRVRICSSAVLNRRQIHIKTQNFQLCYTRFYTMQSVLDDMVVLYEAKDKEYKMHIVPKDEVESHSMSKNYCDIYMNEFTGLWDKSEDISEYIKRMMESDEWK